MPLDTSTPLPPRRSILQAAGLGAAALGVLAAGTRPAAASNGVSITEVLNFALNLEYLEAEFYLLATTGMGIPSGMLGGKGRPGNTVGGSRVPFVTTRLARIAEDIASDEFTHVKFLRAALGADAVAKPKIDLMTSFTTLARAAGVVGPNGQFDPFADENSFILGAYVFEDVGVTAYHGAAGYLIGDLDVLGAAAGILAVEAYHAGAIRAEIISSVSGLNYMADQISQLRATLSGAADDFGPLIGHHANITDSDANAIAFSRTPQQVLNIVYGNTSATPGLFFPNGMNGKIS